MAEDRPNPDTLLAQMQAQEARQARGKLKVFFGASPGVGKTYAMLSEGRARYAEGVDVVVGYAEPHARPETEALLLGMDILPHAPVEYKGRELKEFDLDAALKRRPELLLVDELAHTNAAGSRHAKRWQDVEELLQAGVDVYTTLNVQHLESLNDVVAQITGVVVKETLPDAVLEKADEIELIDLPPDNLLERLSEGKVYVPDQAQRAVQGFFRKPNLTALRELALRKTAERVNLQVQSARAEQAPGRTWATTDRILVCISASPTAGRVIRAAKRSATSQQAQWIACFVETPQLQRMSERSRARLLQNFRLAERLGAETVTLTGRNIADEVVNYAQSRNVTRIIVGKPERSRWREMFRGSTVDDLVRKSGDIQIELVRGHKEEADGPPGPRPSETLDWREYAKTAAVVALCTAISYGMHAAHHLERQGDLSNLIMIYLLGVAIVAVRWGRLPATLAAGLSVLVFDFCFVPPRYQFAVTDTRYVLTFAVMLAIGLLIGTLTAQIREQVDASRRRERRTESLYRLARALANAPNLDSLLQVACDHLQEVFQCQARILLPRDLRDRGEDSGLISALLGSERAVAQWVLEHHQIAGSGTDTLPSAGGLYWPLLASGGAVGVVRLNSRDSRLLLGPEQRQLLEASLDQIALAIERGRLADDAARSTVRAETEKMRSSLLSSVSHDLRTPLAVIVGASTGLSDRLKEPVERELAQTIRDEADRLGRLVGNLLDITRVEGGALEVTKQWHVFEEIVGSALNRLTNQLTGHPIRTSLPDELPSVPVDGVLIEQVLLNLLDNAARYTPPGTAIEISATADPQEVLVSVMDHGPGLAPDEMQHVFDKFFRGHHSAASVRGTGLGLAICRGIIEAHGGRIWAQNAPVGGAVFQFTLPLDGKPPPIDPNQPPM